MKYAPSTLIALLLLLLASMQASSVEHPVSIPGDVNCSSCHANKTNGVSVHSAMALSCTICHMTQTEGDMTTMNLFMPKEKICFACHEESAAQREHSPVVKGQCVECHDTHSSRRRSLLREQVDVRRP